MVATDQTRVGDVVAAIESAYPPVLAEEWDAVGLVCGDPQERARRVLVCVDVTDDVVDVACEGDYGLVVAHHPLLLRGVESVAATTPKGRLIHRLIRSGVALHTAHTNADSARPGVSDALATALGITDTRPIAPASPDRLDKWVVMVPDGDAEQVSAAMFAAGAGAIGDYRDCSWSVVGIGQFEAHGDANPTIGEVGSRTRVDEARVEMVADRGLRSRVLAALRTAHPYEEPAFDVLELAALPADVGLGRIGRLVTPTSLGDFVETVARVLRCPGGARATGNPEREIRTVAVCGGAGDSLLGAVRAAGVDAYVTADLRHHPADEALRWGGPALIDAGHWATEYPWCAQVADIIAGATGVRVDCHDVSTDPFTVYASSPTA